MESVSWSPDWAAREQQTLAPYAMRTSASRGRKYPDQGHPYRSLYQRDRDRIVYSTAFRRLMYKTQVLVNQTNDHHRTRLTHTLEVASISRTIARQLAVNEDLTEAIALAHDLGHPPFGHAGEDALNECMKHHGGFEHNWHGLRILDHLEHRYAEHPGLNLSFEILEAQAYHSKRRDLPEIQTYVSNGQPLLEAQIVDAADSLAYDTHDIDDALTVQLIQFGDLQGVEFWRRAEQRVRERYTSMGAEDFQAAMMRMLIDWQVTDLLAATRRRLSEHDIRSVEQVRGANEVLVRPGDEVLAWKAELERFLHAHVYRHHRVMRMAAKGSRFLRETFAEYCRCPEQLPARYYQRTLTGLRERTVCDYLAGMTDRYAQDEYLRLFQPYTSV